MSSTATTLSFDAKHKLTPAARLKLKAITRSDLQAFAKNFFSDLCHLEWSGLHDYLFKRRAAKKQLALDERRGEFDVVLAPRGAAKSTLISLVFPIHALLFGTEGYIVIISATLRQATQRLANIRRAIEGNAPLAACFVRELRSPPRCTVRSIELDCAPQGKGGPGRTRIEAFSAGTELRGISHGRHRPTWIILDDAERSERCRLAQHRDALHDWFGEVIENLGSPHTHIDVIGTLLHRDALPARLMRRPDVTGRTVTSIISESPATALWNAWRELYHNLENPARVRDARQFFEANREAMLAGSEVLWEAREDYYALQVMRETRGARVFDKEKQNAPWEEGSEVFIIARLRHFDLVGGQETANELDRNAFRETARIIREPARFDDGEAHQQETDAASSPERPLAGLRIFGFLDPALGGAAGDFAAIATVGVDPAGYLYVLDVWLDRAPPATQMERIFELHARWRYEGFGIETNAFQKLLLEPFEAERRRRRMRGEPWDIPLCERRHRGDKMGRILDLEPHARNGWLLFNRTLSAEFKRQLEAFPGGRHDDGPDALAAAVALARTAQNQPARLQTLPRRMGNF